MSLTIADNGMCLLKLYVTLFDHIVLFPYLSLLFIDDAAVMESHINKMKQSVNKQKLAESVVMGSRDYFKLLIICAVVINLNL